MLDQLKELSRRSNYFLENRWDNPLQTTALREKLSCLWPSSDEFYHPLNPMFAAGFTEPQHLNAFSIALLRDGAHTLMDFYLRFPSPKLVKTIFLVPADLYFLVPDAWREQTLAYRLEGRAPKLTKRIVFYGLFSESYLSWAWLQHRFPEWLKTFARDAEVSMYSAIRNELFNHKWDEKTFPFEITSQLQHYFKNPLHFLDYESFKQTWNDAEATLVNLDLLRSGIGLCAIESGAMGRAIQLHPKPTYRYFTGEHIGDWPLSFSHKLAIFKGEAKHTDFGQFFFMNKTFSYPYTPKLIDLLGQRLSPIPAVSSRAI
jgi:hypothetical protein